MNQASQSSSNARRAQQKRLILLIAAAFAVVAWTPRTVKMIDKGWSSSRLALERQQQINEANARLDALQREVAYARTSEGKDVEAKRRFGVGPRDEIWITVDAEVAPEQRPQPQSVADRMDSWLANAGSAFVDRIRDVGAVFSYAVGLSEVDRSVAVPVIDDLEPAEAPDDGDASAGSPEDTAGGDGDEASDGAQQP